MKLQATVIGIKARSDAHDGKRRVELKPEGAYGSFIVPSDDLREDEALTILVLRQDDVRRLVEDYDKLDVCSFGTGKLIESLRPDDPPPTATDNTITPTPPPWESGKPRCDFRCMADSPDHQCLLPLDHTESHTYPASCLLQRVTRVDESATADTQEFRLGGTA